MNRTQIYLEPHQQKILRTLARKETKTISQVIREAINEWIVRHQKPKKKKVGLEAIIGLYSDENSSDGSVNHDSIYDDL